MRFSSLLIAALFAFVSACSPEPYSGPESSNTTIKTPAKLASTATPPPAPVPAVPPLAPTPVVVPKKPSLCEVVVYDGSLLSPATLEQAVAQNRSIHVPPIGSSKYCGKVRTSVKNIIGDLEIVFGYQYQSLFINVKMSTGATLPISFYSDYNQDRQMSDSLGPYTLFCSCQSVASCP